MRILQKGYSVTVTLNGSVLFAARVISVTMIHVLTAETAQMVKRDIRAPVARNGWGSTVRLLIIVTVRHAETRDYALTH